MSLPFSFRLSEDFITGYRDKKAPFGYRDAGGNSIGEITFLRTYSRKKEDGTKETWTEVCERVINGMYSIQKDHCKTNRLPWNDSKAQASAKEAFERLFMLKWTPPGRGLWVMGTPIVNVQRNSAALQNCFTGETRFITRDGIRTLAEANGEEVEVWTASGWEKATVNSFGVQPVQRITFAPFGARSNHRVVETATPDHRWELKDGTATTTLKVDDVVPAQSVRNESPHRDAYIHGLIFADGSINYTYKNGEFSHMMRLCGDKASEVGYFSTVHYQPNCEGDPVVYYRSATNMKALPITDDPAYIASFIDGWAKFDGTLHNTGTIKISTQNREAADWLIDHAALGGYTVTGINTLDNETNFGPRSAPLVRVSLSSLQQYWTVKSIEPLDDPETVYCAIVPEIERFTLASGVYTSNCAFVSTTEMMKSNPAKPFAFLMEASMLGVGVGFDDKGADKGFEIYEPYEPNEPSHVYVIPDTREGWVESVAALVNAYLKPNMTRPAFDYSQIRPAGEPIRIFGGTAAGHQPLEKLHNHINKLFKGRAGKMLSRRDIADIGNMIGVCVVSGNVRRSAELLIGSIDDDEFLNLKNYGEYDAKGKFTPGPAADRQEWGWMSNNSVDVKVGQDLDKIIDGISRNGEPGVLWMDVSRQYGRLADPINNKDWRVAGYNPCAEQSLESFEMCTLTETYLNRHDSLEDYRRTLKFAYLYAKTVTLLPTHWEETNAIMQRNRRIGTSMSGVANFADNHGLPALREWMDTGYATVKSYDNIYSEWLGIRESIKTTTVKPSGTVSILAGESPGVHWTPGGKHFLRTIRFSNGDAMLPLFKMANYRVEPAFESPDTTSVVYFPIESDAKRSDKEVTIWEKMALAAQAQRYWSDNSVSVTISFNAETETQHVGTALHLYDGQLKTVSFLPQGNDIYPQQPYSQITKEEYTEYTMQLLRIDFEGIYEGLGADAIGEAYCTTDACIMKTEASTMKDASK